jgi:hypothetical protein
MQSMMGLLMVTGPGVTDMKPKTAHKLKPGATLMFKGYNPETIRDENYRGSFQPGDTLLFLNMDQKEADNMIVIRLRDKLVDMVFPEEVRRA